MIPTEIIVAFVVMFLFAIMVGWFAKQSKAAEMQRNSNSSN